MKLNKGDYHEIVDRLHNMQEFIEISLTHHPTIINHPKAQKKIDKIQLQLGKLYQKFNKKL